MLEEGQDMAAPETTSQNTVSQDNASRDRKPPAFSHLPFRVAEADETATQLGLVTLETDLTIETELRHFIGDGVGTRAGKGQLASILHSRIACDDQVTVENLTAMKERFADALALFPPGYHFDVIGYGCTSASLLIGEETIQAIVKSHVNVDHVTTPLTGARRALKTLGAKNIGYLAPYISEISQNMCLLLEDDGFRIGAAATFGEGQDSIVGRIHPSSISAAIDALVSNADTPLDAVFISCTSLKCASIIAATEAKHAIPVISSNSAIAWDMARLAGLALPADGASQKGRLFQQN
jgi:maleate isomerase